MAGLRRSSQQVIFELEVGGQVNAGLSSIPSIATCPARLLNRSFYRLFRHHFCPNC
jgi:hypothetical protein